MVFQSYALYPHLSVRENMAFGLKRSTNLPDEAIYDRVEDAAELMGIPELLDDLPKQLSGGQQQRVATGRAIVREPAVFCSTNRSRIWTPSFENTCGPNSSGFNRNSRRRRSTSPTTRRRR